MGSGAGSQACAFTRSPTGRLLSTYYESGTSLVSEVAAVNKLLPSESSQSVGRQKMK